LRVTFLGTSGSVPTLSRNLPSIAVRRKSELFLFDCGEGTQRQMFIARVGFSKKARIFITHMHGDHVLGLPGLIQTMSLLGREEPLEVYGPEGLADFVDAFKRTVQFGLTFPLTVKELNDDALLYRTKEYEVRCVKAEHSVPTFAFAIIEKDRPGKFHPERALALGVTEGPQWSKLQYGEIVTLKNGNIVNPEDVLGPGRPGLKIVYSGDTKPSKKVMDLAKQADLLIHDCTLSDDLKDKALEEGHSTAAQAASVALEAEVVRLALFHVSARYPDPSILLKEAQKIFTNTFVAEDFMSMSIPYKEV
jgi:ribonuclease Z